MPSAGEHLLISHTQLRRYLAVTEPSYGNSFKLKVSTFQAIAKTIEPLRLDLYDRHIWNSKFLIFVNQIFFNSKTISLWKLTFTVRKLTVKIADYLSQAPRCFIRGPVKLRGLFYVESLQFSNA